MSKKKEGIKKVGFSLTEDLHQKLKMAVYVNHSDKVESMSDLVEKAVNAYIDKLDEEKKQQNEEVKKY